MSQIIEAKPRFISAITSPVEKTPKYSEKLFFEQIRLLASLTQLYGRRDQPSYEVHQHLHTLWPHHTDSLNTKLEISTDGEVLGDFQLFRYRHNMETLRIPDSKVSSAIVRVNLKQNGLITIETNPDLYPECLKFEIPDPDPRYDPEIAPNSLESFIRVQQVIKKTVPPLGTVLTRGPITSLGYNTKDFLYQFTNEAYNVFFRKS